MCSPAGWGEAGQPRAGNIGYRAGGCQGSAELTVLLFQDIHRGMIMLASVNAEALRLVSYSLLSDPGAGALPMRKVKRPTPYISLLVMVV